MGKKNPQIPPKSETQKKILLVLNFLWSTRIMNKQEEKKNLLIENVTQIVALAGEPNTN